MSKEAARDAAEAHKALLMGGGGGLLGVGLLLGLTCLGFAGPIERGCMAWNDSQPCKPKWQSCRGWNVFWNMAFWPIGLRDERVERVHTFGVPRLQRSIATTWPDVSHALVWAVRVQLAA